MEQHLQKVASNIVLYVFDYHQTIMRSGLGYYMCPQWFLENHSSRASENRRVRQLLSRPLYFLPRCQNMSNSLLSDHHRH